MSHDDLDRILSGEEEILPSSGFTAAVMEAVRQEAVAPPPIPFPWKRALPGLAAAGLTFAWILVALAERVRAGAMAQVPDSQQLILTPALHAMINTGTGLITVGLLVTLASMALSMRLACGKR